MRRLVAITSKTQKVVLALMALIIALTSIHMAAAARAASLRRQQESLEQPAIVVPPASASQNASMSAMPAATPALAVPGAGPQARVAAAAQGVKANAPAAGMAQPVPARRRQIIISISDRKLALMEDGQVLKTYPIAVGSRHTPSPEGEFVIVNHAKDPRYRHGDKEMAPGKDNPLGTRWMGLSLKGYGIHGTNVQSSVGKAASHGCFRMRQQDVEELYTLVQVGDAVTIRRERDALVSQVFGAQGLTAPSAAEPSAKPPSNAEVQVASSAAATVETTQE